MIASESELPLRRAEAIVLLFAGMVFLTSLISPPALMDDVDGAQAQMSRNILESGDWVTMRLNGIADLEKPPLLYWMIAASFRVFGVHDWAARIPTCLSAILLSWLVTRMAGRYLGAWPGLYAGLSLATSIGMWLFTRVLLHDIVLTLAVTLAMWSFLRAQEDNEPRWRRWALSFWAAIAAGVLAKGLIAALLPAAAMLLYLLLTGLWRERQTRRRLLVPQGLAVFLAIAAPWHILATLRNPPWFDFTLHGGGHYRGFFWFYFLNEHLLRFLNLRYPHDYSSLPKTLFWLLQFVWLFPWSVFLIRAAGLRYRGLDNAARMRLFAVCWIASVLAFFTVSTAQEYYSMPAYPAFALLIGSAMAESSERAWRRSMGAIAGIAAMAFIAIAGILFATRSLTAQGDISQALASNPGNYTFSLGHMGDLTLRSFAYLSVPLAVAGLAMLIGAAGGIALRGRPAAAAVAIMMVLFFQAARLALIAFNPYLGSRVLAEALNRAPAGGLIVDDAWFEMSSLFFYTNRSALILNGRVNNLEYGSNAPGAPGVFIGDADFVKKWKSPQRWYVATEDIKVPHLNRLAGAGSLHPIARAGGKAIYSNR